MNVLNAIVAAKRREVERSKQRLPASLLRERAQKSATPGRFSDALRHGEAPNVVAEVKRASPSAGLIRGTGRAEDWDPVRLASEYKQGGAVCLSVLTDIQFFWGHPDVLFYCSQATDLPSLRKDFILDPYQVDESRLLGADAVLLIARILEPSVLVACAERASELGMDTLVEIHHERELESALLAPGAMVGVNHRDLDTLEVNLDLSVRLRERIPGNRIAVAESGVSDRAQIKRLMQEGYQNFLIGEHLVRQKDPAAELRRLRK